MMVCDKNLENLRGLTPCPSPETEKCVSGEGRTALTPPLLSGFLTQERGQGGEAAWLHTC